VIGFEMASTIQHLGNLDLQLYSSFIAILSETFKKIKEVLK